MVLRNLDGHVPINFRRANFTHDDQNKDASRQDHKEPGGLDTSLLLTIAFFIGVKLGKSSTPFEDSARAETCFLCRRLASRCYHRSDFFQDIEADRIS